MCSGARKECEFYHELRQCDASGRLHSQSVSVFRFSGGAHVDSRLKIAQPRADDGSLGVEAGMTARRPPGIGSTDERRANSHCSDKSTPIARSVRKAEGLEAETARLPKKRKLERKSSIQMPTEAYPQ